MDNYEHEIVCPDNKGIRNYLWYDHFHDSKIDSIFFNQKKGLVTLTLECCRDIEEIWNKLKCAHDARRTYIIENIDSFTYILTFKGTKYFHSERLIMVNDYINGRFKNTALLKKLTAENKKPLYHFRIQIDDGYMDIIFSDFIIRKKSGRVKYSIKEVTYQSSKSLTDDEKKALLDGDDFDRFLAMQKLLKINETGLLGIARNNLRLNEEHKYSCLYSAYLLGKLGDVSDIPNLLDLFLNIEEYIVTRSACRCSAILIKRNIIDAIELIHQRNANNF
jgi:hypothetical protein